MPFRYESQIELIGAGQIKLRDAHVIVFGAGGLGSTILQMLAGAGVGHIVIFDGDKVEKQNLHRQTLYRESDIGKNKAEAAKHQLQSLNSEIHIESVPFHFVTLDQIECYMNDNPILVDAGDNFDLTGLLSEICQDRYFVTGSAIRHSGYCGIFGNGIDYRDVFTLTSGSSCSSVGILGPVVGMIGMLQSQLVLDLILGKENNIGKLFRWNGEEMQLVEIDLNFMRGHS